ncbi:initiator tRNA phosphoribosyl transferase [Mycena alexandri]|uniref:Initiator tRNA phosphoribosyl transferase n=1 Tax=Mycena alexandri TaxID=1745969 RepID=A0AAD6SU82_9AGAR|nr:initiator tRNA phosphoribosyl transferase [Mycena alexandri]
MVDAHREALAFLRKESLDVFNRLHSINEDVAFVNQVHAVYSDIPILPNLRCGAWYTDPAIATDCPAYFKSTDGHFSNWSFNLRRPNLHLLPLAAKNDGKGIVLVDSTRAGKRLPDALAKTVPIWCVVVNRAVLLRFPENKEGWDTALYTPPAAVSAQEHAQIAARIDVWAEALATSSYTLPNLPRPLRPVWVTPASGTLPIPPPTCIPIICVSASQVADGTARRAGGFAYIQGSGDDHELWGEGLTPELFWTHRTALLEAQRGELPALAERLVTGSASVTTAAPATRVGPTPIARVNGRLLIGALADVPTDEAKLDADTAYILILPSTSASPSSTPSPPSLAAPSRILRLPSPTGKKSQLTLLQSIFPQSVSFARSHLHAVRRLCIACEDGADLSVGVALVLLGVFLGGDGALLPSLNTSDSEAEGASGPVMTPSPTAGGGITKETLRTRLEWIIASRPTANPSRATLKRVNEFLMSERGWRRGSSVDR